MCTTREVEEEKKALEMKMLVLMTVPSLEPIFVSVAVCFSFFFVSSHAKWFLPSGPQFSIFPGRERKGE